MHYIRAYRTFKRRRIIHFVELQKKEILTFIKVFNSDLLSSRLDHTHYSLLNSLELWVPF